MQTECGNVTAQLLGESAATTQDTTTSTFNDHAIDGHRFSIDIYILMDQLRLYCVR
jgi:hypothetical protein